MDSLPVNVTDIAVAAVVIISALLALSKGLVRELLGVAGWIGAIFATLYGFPYVKPYAREIISLPILADAAAGLAVFVGSLLVLSLVSRYIASHIHASTLNAIDRSLGFLYGLARGAVIVCVAYLLVDWVMPPKEQPGWLREARTMPYIVAGADLIRDLLPNEGNGSSGAARAEPSAAEAIGTGRGAKDLAPGQANGPANGQDDGGTGYGNSARRDMERLIQTTKDR